MSILLSCYHMFRRRMWSYRLVSNMLSYAPDVEIDQPKYYGRDYRGRVVYYARPQFQAKKYPVGQYGGGYGDGLGI